MPRWENPDRRAQECTPPRYRLHPQNNYLPEIRQNNSARSTAPKHTLAHWHKWCCSKQCQLGKNRRGAKSNKEELHIYQDSYRKYPEYKMRQALPAPRTPCEHNDPQYTPLPPPHKNHPGKMGCMALKYKSPLCTRNHPSTHHTVQIRNTQAPNTSLNYKK